MFEEGRRNNAHKWLKEEIPSSTSVLKPRIDPIIGTRDASGRLGLPPLTTMSFRSGHLPASTIHLTRTMHDSAEDSESGSENDMDTESDEGLPPQGRHSLDSSPRVDKARQRLPRYTTASDYSYSDVSSSIETLVSRHGPMVEKLMHGNARLPVRQKDLEEDELTDSAASTEFSTTQVGSMNGAVPGGRGYYSEGYASSVPSGVYATETIAQKDNARKLLDFPDDDLPTAPPFSASAQEVKEGNEHMLATTGQDKIKPMRDPQEITNTVRQMSRTTDINEEADSGKRATPGPEFVLTSGTVPPRLPAFHASALGPWHAVIAYDACVRLCLNAWARGCMEAPMFLDNECLLLRNTFGLQKVLLQSEEELCAKQSSEVTQERASANPKKMIGKLKVQVRKVKTILDPPSGCNILALRPNSSLKPHNFSKLHLALSAKWKAFRNVPAVPRLPANGSVSRQSMAYVHAGTHYLKQVSGLLKTGVTSLRNSSSSYEVMQETYSCSLRLKSLTEEDAIRMQPGSGETHVFFPDSVGDDLIVEVQDSKGKHYGRVLVQLATISESSNDKLRWWSIYREPEHELVGKLQLYINYSTSSEDNSQLKYGTVAETVAYDLVLEVAMKVQKFQQRNLLLHNPWKWLLAEFASYYGVSDVYTKLRYLSYIMDVATPTADCLTLVYELLAPILMKGQSKGALSHQENRILGEAKDQIEQILAITFENYKSLDESSSTGIIDVFRPATGVAAPALEPAIKLYTLLHDILSPEAQTNFCHYFQVAVRKRSRRHLTETDEYVTHNSEGALMDPVFVATAYQKMTSLCVNIKKEIFTDIEINNQHILPSFVDLPNLSAAIYSTELSNRLRMFLTACPPSGPSPPVAELVIATADFQRDLSNWKISPVKGGVDAKELFHLYILVWIQDKRISLLESCKLDKVKWSGVRTQHSTTPFVDEMYDRLREMLSDYEVIICRWPEYIFVLENAIADVEKAVVEALDKQYADVLSPLKENLTPKKFGFKYVQKLTKRSVSSYIVPDELGILLNSLKRMLDVLRPKLEIRFKSWGSCMPNTGNTAPGERLSEVTVMLRAKFRNYMQAVVEKLTENTKLQPSTKLKKILQDSKGTVVESDVQCRMQPLKEQLIATINHLYTIFETHVFVALSRGYWDRLGQDVLSFLGNRKENKSWYRCCRIAASVLDDTFGSQMQKLLGNALQEKDLEPPRSIMEVRSILCKDGLDNKGNPFYY